MKFTGKIIWPKKFTDLIDSILKIVLIASAVAASYEYFESKKEAKIAMTFSYLNRFNSGDIFTSREKINYILDSQIYNIQKLGKIKVKSKIEKNIIKDRFLKAIFIESHKEIALIESFYSELYICIKEKICDKETSLNFFGPYSENLYSLLYPTIEEKRKNYPTYAKNYELFTDLE